MSLLRHHSHKPSRLAPSLRLKLVGQWAQQLARRSPDTTEAGLTLIECIVAIVIVSIVGVAITPPLFLATAARVQTNRAEQAVQVAQGEVDKVRVLVEQGNYTGQQLPGPGDSREVTTVSPPTKVHDKSSSTNQKCDQTLKNFDPPPANELLEVDVNGDCQSDFLVQVFRSEDSSKTVATTSDGNTIPLVFGLGVRVWTDTPAFRSNLGSLQFEDMEPASLEMRAGTGDQSRRPLAVAYTRIVRSDLNVSYKTFCISLNEETGGDASSCK